ncbi:sensor histidine kinase [Paenibacillus daejeonensis]|uniref:sensor histidine kinase n=1 Tax=Paenibacillus daejeonensis TaxID=135193 RepID=UPI000380CF9A|nr:ATP-binding protein [Paenibacillus daejeonensis]
MTRSLYTRVVLIFLAAVIGGTVISFLLSTRLHREQLNENLLLPLLYIGQDMIRLYETLPADEAEAYVSGMQQLHAYHIRIYESPDHYRSYGKAGGFQAAEATADQVRQVLDGELLQLNPTGVSTSLLGLPFSLDSQSYALFIQSTGPPSSSFIMTWMLNFVVYALIVGSLVVLLSAFFLVRPIQKLTRATRQIAGGDFEVQLDIKQRGELGELARSFEKMARDLSQLEELRKEFVANVSHEIQSPLTSITGYAKALQHLPADESERVRYLGIIVDEAARMSKLSDNLLKLSLLESESQQLKPVSYSLAEQIRQVVITLEPQWRERRISLEFDLEEGEITADPDLLVQVWTNVLGNSIKFSPDESLVEVSTEQNAASWVVRITDHGIGIPLDDQERIFERFFKADRAHSGKHSGSGMGLAIVKRIVSLHHGHITVESELGSGTSLVIHLPQSV